MPTYEYVCQECGEEFEYFQSISEEPKTHCEKCGGRLERLVGTGGGLIFKGSGFYITDYKRGNGGNGSKPSEGKSAPEKATTGSERKE
jgi:putative FmdB family regulatory protein